MNKTEWDRRSGELRQLMRELVDVAPNNSSYTWKRVKTQFGACWYPDASLWYLYNSRTDNCIGSVKVTNSNYIIRYRLKSWYRDVMTNFTVEGKTVVAVPSLSLKHRAKWLKDSMKGDFSNKKNSPFKAKITVDEWLWFRDSLGTAYQTVNTANRRTSYGEMIRLAMEDARADGVAERWVSSNPPSLRAIRPALNNSRLRGANGRFISQSEYLRRQQQSRSDRGNV